MTGLCAECWNEYKPANANQVYCSRKCRVIVNQKKNKKRRFNQNKTAKEIKVAKLLKVTTDFFH